MLRFTIVAAALAAATPLAAQSTATDASSMTCADYMALQQSDRPGILESIFGGERQASATTSETTLEARADVSAEELAEACEGNDDMSVVEAAEAAKSD